jgi:hypothetical protein
MDKGDVYLYRATGGLSDILMLISGVKCFLGYAGIEKNLKLVRLEQDQSGTLHHPNLICLPHGANNLNNAIVKLEPDQVVLILWHKRKLQTVHSIHKCMSEVGLKDIHSAFLFPNWHNPTHLVVSDGIALRKFLHYRLQAGRIFSPKYMVKRLACFLNLLQLNETSLICWAKVK